MKKYSTFLFSILFCLGVLGSIGASIPFSWSTAANTRSIKNSAWLEKQIQIIKSQTTNLDDQVLRLSLIAYQKARLKGINEKQILTVIDFSKPSYEKRMWIFDLKSNRMLYHTWVAHGKNSGGTVATSFSNTPGSLKSSIGVFATEKSYTGGKGYSLKLKGLEPGINDNAYKRSVVIHGAWYAKENHIKQNGKLGRSWGCPAISPELTKPIINTIKHDTLVVAYYPDQKWLSQSQFLTG